MKIYEISQDSPEPIYYFAYGMLTDPQYVPDGKPVGAAVLNNYKFEFRYYANINEASGEKVYGALWEIPRELLSHLDMVEGVPYLYGRKQVPVFSQGQRYEAWVYYMTPTSKDDRGSKIPSERYISILTRGYRKFGLPKKQIELALDQAQRDYISRLKFFRGQDRSINNSGDQNA